MIKKEATEVMERIKKYFMDIHYPLKHVYNRENTVGQVFSKALEALSK